MSATMRPKMAASMVEVLSSECRVLSCSTQNSALATLHFSLQRQVRFVLLPALARAGAAGGRGFDLDVAVDVEVQRRQLPVVLADAQPVEPQAIVLRVGEPAARLLLLVIHDGAADLTRPRVVAGGN